MLAGGSFLWAALREEQKFAASPLGRRPTAPIGRALGMFVPKLFGRDERAAPLRTPTRCRRRCDVPGDGEGQRRRPELDLLRITACLIPVPLPHRHGVPATTRSITSRTR